MAESGKTFLEQRIDFLRGLFSIWVWIAHTVGLGVSFATDFHPETSWGKWLLILMKSGYIGVMGFFFLSGFCIQWSIQNSIGQKDKSRFSLRQYFWARVSRIAPLFYVGLILAVLVHFACQHFLKSPPENPIPPFDGVALASSFFFMQGIFRTYPFYGPSWSITNEILYYAAWPLICIATRFQYKKALIFSGLIAILLTGSFYIIANRLGTHAQLNLTALWTIPMAAIMWVIGAACKIYYESILSSSLFRSIQKYWAVIFIIWVFWATSLIYFDLSLVKRTILDPFGYLAIPLLILSDWNTPLSHKANGYVADLSYPLYIFHGPLLAFFAFFLYTFNEYWQQGGIALGSGLGALLVSATIGVRLERFLLRKRSIFMKRFSQL